MSEMLVFNAKIPSHYSRQLAAAQTRQGHQQNIHFTFETGLWFCWYCILPVTNVQMCWTINYKWKTFPRLHVCIFYKLSSETIWFPVPLSLLLMFCFDNLNLNCQKFFHRYHNSQYKSIQIRIPEYSNKMPKTLYQKLQFQALIMGV